MDRTTFKTITIRHWKQFEAVHIDFHPTLTVLTGANGSGKTTILNLLGSHFGWSNLELATPAKDRKTGIIRFIAGFFSLAKNLDSSSSNREIGELTYTNHSSTRLEIPNSDSPQYSVAMPSQQGVNGLSIPSHRPTFVYQRVDQISTESRTKTDALNLVVGTLRNFSQGGGGRTGNYYIKETLLNWALGGDGNEFIEPDPEKKKNFYDFQNVVQKVLPPTLGFRKFSIRRYEIVLVTDSGEFMLDAVSGGITAIIELAWQIFTSLTQSKDRLTVLIDEVENHLHPAMQRSILPSFLKAFPNVQFIVSTHSPLIVGSVADSNVYVFRQIKLNHDLRFESHKLDLLNKAKSASEILDEVLDVPFLTMPVWVEGKLNEIVKKYSDRTMDTNSFDQMRQELKSVGLEDLMPSAIRKTLRDDQAK